ncbi:MAG TPA: AMP-binding protein [Casimicrobiaceae bacterium]|nr:AMP-binding protein [Casimicrobiaceae bacterium]
MRFIDFFDQGAARNPDAPCFIHDETEQTFTFRHLREITLRTANALRVDGFSIGMKGAVLSPNDAVGFACLLGIVRAGMVWVAINPRNAVDENCFILDNFECEVLFYHSAFEQAIEAIRKRVPRIRRYVCIDGPGNGAVALLEWVREHAADEIDPGTGPDDLVLLQTTGGTTGVPKGAMHTNRSLEGFFANMYSVFQFEDTPPVYLAAAPITHAGGYLALFVLAQGGTVVLQSKVDPKLVCSAIERRRISFLYLPPTAVYGLIAAPAVKEHDLSSLRYFTYGAAPMAPEKLRECLRIFGPVMLQAFGQTETLFPVTYLSRADHGGAGGGCADEKRLTSCGRPAPFARLGIMDESGNLLGDGEHGEIVVRATSVMAGYYKNPEETARAHAFGWHHTGDIGYRDADGFYYIVDRKKDMIVTGGFNVWSVEVEKVLQSHPAVMDCAVIGIPDEKWGEAVHAVVELKYGQSVAGEELIALCKDKIGSVKAPKGVEFIDTLPRSAVGKVLKRRLRDRYWQGHARRVG